MEDKKIKICEDILDSLTMEDLWKSPRLKGYIEKHYPRAFAAITEPMREFGLWQFIKIAESQQKAMKEALDFGSRENFPKRNINYAIKVIKQNKIKPRGQLWHGGVPFKFELSKFVQHYASEKTFREWRAILKDLGATKANIDRILERYKNKFK